MTGSVPTIQIRRAAPEDAAAISQVLLDAFTEYRALYTDEGFAVTTPVARQVEKRMGEAPVWVALLDGTIVGTVAVVPRGESLYIRGMAVRPKARGHRIGDLLLDAVETFAVEHGHERLYLSTTPFLERAIRLYERRGFRRIGAGPHDLFGTPLFTMEKPLDAH